MTLTALVARRGWIISRRWGVLGAIVLLLSSGCAGTTSGTLVYEYPATYVDTVPADIAHYPRVYYRGRYAYWVNDRWYYPSGRRWVVFREEPRELRRYRVYNPQRFEAAPRRYRPTTEFGIPEHRRYRAPQVAPDAQPRYRAPEVAPEQQPRYRRAPAPAPRERHPVPQHAPRAPQEERRYYRPR